MKRLHFFTLACLLLSLLFFLISLFVQVICRDKTVPVIDVPEMPLTLSVKNYSSEALLAGVTAHDEKDGDLTDHILLRTVTKEQGNNLKAVFSVFDSNNHVATAERFVTCSGYIPPLFHLSEPLSYTPGSTIRVRDRLTADDLLDGDLSGNIKVKANNISPHYEGTYPVTFEVTNSLGDTSSITLDIVVRSQTVGEPEIHLRDYLIYGKAHENIDPMEYVDYVSNGDESSILAELPDGGLQQGINKITYFCRGDNGVLGSTTLYVVAE